MYLQAPGDRAEQAMATGSRGDWYVFCWPLLLVPSYFVSHIEWYHAVLAFIGIAGSFYIGRSSSPCYSSGQGSGKDQVSPEGRILGSYDMLHDFRGRPRFIESERAAVASDHGRCADQGVEVMRGGGNAADAAVVTALCQGLYNPMASGIGGGHIMVVRYVFIYCLLSSRRINDRHARCILADCQTALHK